VLNTVLSKIMFEGVLALVLVVLEFQKQRSSLQLESLDTDLKTIILTEVRMIL
jgi:hypothetical protein